MGIFSSKKKYLKKDVEKHHYKNDCWIIVKDKVYDVTVFLDSHPIGRDIILMNGGNDCNKHLFFHSKYANSILKKYFIGYLILK